MNFILIHIFASPCNILYINSVFIRKLCKKLQMKHKACIRHCAVLSKGFYLRAEEVYTYMYTAIQKTIFFSSWIQQRLQVIYNSAIDRTY